MAKFYGNVGYVQDEVETAPGVWTTAVEEKPYYGDVVRNSRKIDNNDVINNNLSVGNSINISADEFAYDHIFSIAYVVWRGVRWIVADVTVERPRLILRLGGIYNGPTPAPVPPTA